MSSAYDRLAQRLRDPRISHTAMDDGTAVLMDIDQGRLLTLNRTGAAIVDHLLAGCDAEDNAGRLASRFGIDEHSARLDLDSFVEQLSVTLQTGTG